MDSYDKTISDLVQPRIHGVRPARKGEFLFHVLITYTDDGSMIFGGNMINDRWIITAAECLKRNERGRINHIVIIM